MVGEGQAEPVRPAGAAGGDAERGRRGGGGTRRAADRRAGDELHIVPGPDADDPGAAPHRGRAPAGRAARGGPHGGGPRAVDLRRPQRRDELPQHRLCHAVLRQRAGGHGPGGHRPPGRDQGARAVHALLRRLPHQPRDRQGAAGVLRRFEGAHRHRRAGRLPRPGAEPGAPDDPRHRAEPGHLLPGARGQQRRLRRAAGHRGELHGEAGRGHGPEISLLRLLRRAGRRARGGGHGQRVRLRAGDRGRPERRGGEGGLRAGAPVPALRREALRGRAAGNREGRGRAGPHQGDGLRRRAAVPGRLHRAAGTL